MGRIYLPLEWMAEAGVEPEAFLADPLPTDEVRAMVSRLLREADRLYRRSEAGVPALPRQARTGIYAARFIYAGIATGVRRNGCDSISLRARTTQSQKVGWLALSALRATASIVMPRSPVIFARPLDEVRFLVDAAAHRTPQGLWGEGRTGALLGVLAELKARETAVGQSRLRA